VQRLRDHSFRGIEKHSLGYLELENVAQKLIVGENAFYQKSEAWVAKLDGRKIDRHSQVIACLPPYLGLPASLAENPLAERHD
jgi:hypothetical protein